MKQGLQCDRGIEIVNSSGRIAEGRGEYRIQNMLWIKTRLQLIRIGNGFSGRREVLRVEHSVESDSGIKIDYREFGAVKCGRVNRVKHMFSNERRLCLRSYAIKAVGIVVAMIECGHCEWSGLDAGEVRREWCCGVDCGLSAEAEGW